MNAETGRSYLLGADVFGEAPIGTQAFVPEEPVWGGRQLTADESEAMSALSRGEPIVRVSEEAFQKLRLGERELDRRAKRWKASKAARKRNR